MSPLVGIKGENDPTPYIMIIVITAIILIILQLVNMKVFKKLNLINDVDFLLQSAC